MKTELEKKTKLEIKSWASKKNRRIKNIVI